MDEIISINVGGTLFTTKKNTLCKSKFFVAKLNSDWKSDDMVDTSPENFVHVLNYMRNPNYSFEKKLSYELDFYGIDYDINKLYDPDAKLNIKFNEIIYSNARLSEMIKEKLEIVKNEIVGVYNKLCEIETLKKDKLIIHKKANNICIEDGCTDQQAKYGYFCYEHSPSDDY